MSKKCTVCGVERPLDQFGRSGKGKDGLRYDCKHCQREYYRRNKEQFRQRYLNDRENKIEYQMQWMKNNPDKKKEYAKRHARQVVNRLWANLRSRYTAVSARKLGDAVPPFRLVIGCSKHQFLEYISSLFVEGMSFDNYPEWELDHIIPICHFDLKRTDHLFRCFKYTNVQPLWKHDHQRKGTLLPNGKCALKSKRKRTS